MVHALEPLTPDPPQELHVLADYGSFRHPKMRSSRPTTTNIKRVSVAP
jgi:hypothetical protein